MSKKPKMPNSELTGDFLARVAREMSKSGSRPLAVIAMNEDGEISTHSTTDDKVLIAETLREVSKLLLEEGSPDMRQVEREPEPTVEIVFVTAEEMIAKLTGMAAPPRPPVAEPSKN